MAFRVGATATVWEIRENNGVVQGRLNTRRKDQETDKWVQDWGAWVTFGRDVKTAAANLKARDRIKIGKCSTTNKYDEQKKTLYTNYYVDSFELADSSNDGGGYAQNSGAGNSARSQQMGVAQDDDLPF